MADVALTVDAEPLPLAADSNGVLRVGGTRVALDTVIGAFNAGAAPDAIVLHCDSLRLGGVYLVLGYYLRHRAEVDSYLTARRQRGEERRVAAEAKAPWREVRERLLARRKVADAAPVGGRGLRRRYRARPSPPDAGAGSRAGARRRAVRRPDADVLAWAACQGGGC
jgi:hypothetical protein